MQKLLLASVVLGLFLSLGMAPAGKEYAADRFDVVIAVQPDGSLIVTETVVFRFAGGPFTYVWRELPTTMTDGINHVAGSMDGRNLPPGTRAGQLEIVAIKDGPIKITWHFEPTFDSTHTFVLSYQVLGVIQQETGADVLTWRALPDRYDYQIRASTVQVTYPATLNLVSPPVVRYGRAQIATAPGRVTFTATDLPARSPLEIGLRFPPGSLITAPPRWQVRNAEINRMAPFGIGSALALLILGLVGMLAAWWRQRRPEVAYAVAGADTRQTAPPSDLPPALAGVLLSYNTEPTWAHALATLFDLGRRGLLAIEESPEKHWYRRYDFILRLLSQPGDLRPHERGLLSLLFEGKQGWVDAIKLSQISRGLSSRWKQFAEPLKQEVEAAGLVSPERRQLRRQWLALGLLLLVAALISIGVGIALLPSFGPWPFLIMAVLFVLSIIAFVLTAGVSPLSARGWEEAQAWKGFSRYLQEVTRGREQPQGLELFERYLPYAAACDLAEKWARAFQQEGRVQIPPWFRALATSVDDGSGAFVAMLAATHATGGSGAGAAGAGGAAGGGGSGAG